MLSLYWSANLDGMLVHPDGPWGSRRRVYLGGVTSLEMLNEGQITALVKLAYRCNPKDLGKHKKVRFYDGVRWAHTGRKYTIRVHTMV